MQENKRPRGRPATGKARPLNVTISVTEDERNQMRNYSKAYQISLTDLILKAIEKKIK